MPNWKSNVSQKLPSFIGIKYNKILMLWNKIAYWNALEINAAEFFELGAEISNPSTILPKRGTYKTDIDIRFLNAINDVPKNHSSWLPVQVSIPRYKRKPSTTTDLFFAYHQVPLTLETQKIVHFVNVIEQNKQKRGLFGRKTLPGFSLEQWLIFLLQ